MNAPVKSTTLMTASRQWASRPADQRFTSLFDMEDHFEGLRARSAAKVVSSRRINFQPTQDDPMTGLEVVGPNGNPYNPTHFSFGQLAQLAGAPAGYLRKLPAALAADALNWGMKHERAAEDVGVLLRIGKRDEDVPFELAAATGPNYGRIWNADIVRQLTTRFGDGVTGDFKVPGEFGHDVPVTKANTTMYASDRDMFVFLADEKRRIEVPGRRNGETGSLARGFFIWNSEVGSSTFGVAMFLFDYVCCNRIVWGAQDYREVRIRHTAKAPDRFLEEVEPVLVEYAESSAKPVEDMIAAAQAKKVEDAKDFLANRFSAKLSTAIMQAHEEEEGRPIETIWDVSTGVTAYAKSIRWQDERVQMEREAGKILDLAL